MPLPAFAAVLARAAGPLIARAGPSLSRALGSGGSAASQAATKAGAQATRGSLSQSLAGATSQSAPTASAVQSAASKPVTFSKALEIVQKFTGGAGAGGSSASASAAKSSATQAASKPVSFHQAVDIISSFSGGGSSGGGKPSPGPSPGGGAGGGSGGAAPPGPGPAPGSPGGAGGGGAGGGGGGGGNPPPGPGPGPPPGPSPGGGGFNFGQLGTWLTNNGPQAARAAQHAIGIGAQAGQYGMNFAAGAPEQRVYSEATDALERISRADFRVLLEMPTHMRKWAEELLDGRRAIAQYNSSLAATFARSEVRGMQRDIESGQRTAGSTENLADSLDDLKDEIQPYGDAITNVLQTMVGGQLRIYTALIKLAPIAVPAAANIKFIADWINRFGPKSSGDSLFTSFLESTDKRLDDPFLPPPLARRRGPF